MLCIMLFESGYTKASVLPLFRLYLTGDSMPSKLGGPTSSPSSPSRYSSSTTLSSTTSSSNLVKFPPPQFRRGSLRDFADEEDESTLVEDLIENKDKYKSQIGDSSTITILSFSNVLRLNLDRIQAKVPYKPSRNSIVSACLYRGVVALRKDDRVTDLINVRTRYKLVDSGVDAEINSFIGGLLNSYSLSCPGGGKRCNVLIPREYCGMASDLANDIGMSISAVTTLTIMMALTEQEETVKGDSEVLRQHVRSFYRGVGVRVKACNALLEVYGL